MRPRRLAIPALIAVMAIAAAPTDTRAERLPVRKYSTTDGLSSDYVIGIYRDARGFLWFSTRDGLSRFDGYRFKHYGVADGLPNATVNSVLETRAGVYWVATNGGGVCRFNPLGHRPSSARSATVLAAADSDDALFVSYQVGEELEANRVNILYEVQTDGNGLASMRRRAAALGGSLLVDSKPGHGTAIVFELVRRPASGDAPETRSCCNV